MRRSSADLSGAEMPPMLSRLMDIVRISALAELASGVAHEINQPLAAIAAFSQAGIRLLDRDPPAVLPAIEVLRQISDEALRAGEGIRSVRRLFDPASSERSLCQLPDLVRELRPVLELLTGAIGGELHIEHAADLPPVYIDRLRIQHVLFALVQNACDACAGLEAPKVVISWACDRYTLETRVSDAGPPVPPELQAQLFRPFFTTKAHGTGLGLASSRAALEAHGGAIGFVQAPHGGKRVWFRLPLGRDEDEQA
ncbi:MAG TPA: ATP-binding protein [Steroidobacteraceae bacterium]|nr:ATP-binding protein [Steroidobacteraceae bacterium]